MGKQPTRRCSGHRQAAPLSLILGGNNMPEQHGLCQAADIANEKAVDLWDKAAEEFASFFDKDEEFYHKHIIMPTIVDVLGKI